MLALAIVVLCVGSWEAFWRDHGFVPAVADDVGLWALARHRANEQGADAVVLVGSSRMQMDIQRDAFARATGWKPAVQLAVVRGSSVPVLENLANDPKFLGTVICEVYPVLFFANTPNIDGMLDGHFRAFEEFSLGRNIEQRLSMQFQRSFATRLPDLAFDRVRQAWGLGRLLRPTYNAYISDERFRYGDYLAIPNLEMLNRASAHLYATTTPKVFSPEELARRLRSVALLVDRIHDRGGKVIFVHLPAALFVLDHEERWWKREATWDKLAKATRASLLHYRDYPRLDAFRPPDGIHLGRAAADVFSLRLGEILVEMSLAPGPT
jgi:hypothetical protein